MAQVKQLIVVSPSGQIRNSSLGDTILFPAGTTAGASGHINTGVAPTSPGNGDYWYDGTGYFFRSGGINIDLLGAGFWTQSGGNLYPTTLSDRVGIGTNTPLSNLSIQGSGGSLIEMGDWSSIPAFAAIYLNGLFSTDASAYNFLSTTTGQLIINRQSSAAILFREQNVDQVIIDTGGFVGIGVIAPLAFLDITAATTSHASIHITNSVTVNPTTPNSGDLWWNGTNFYFYNGSINVDLLAFLSALPNPIRDNAGGLTGNKSIDYVNKQLFSSNLGPDLLVLDYNLLRLIDTSGVPAVDWDNRELLDSGFRTLSWTSKSFYTGAGGSSIAAWGSSSEHFQFAASTSAKAQLNFTPGANKTSPVDGDNWYNGTNFNFRKGSTTFDLLFRVAFQTNGTPNGSQALVNLSAGTNITLVDNGTGTVTINSTGGGSGPTLQVNGTPNVDQTLLNLIAGTNITLTDNGAGGVTIDSSGSGGGVYTLDASGNIYSSNANAPTLGALNNYISGTGSGNAAMLTGDDNVVLGTASGLALDGGFANTFLGAATGQFISTGSSNVIIGNAAGGFSTNITFCTLIGTSADCTDGITRGTAIGHAALVNGSNSVVLGNYPSFFDKTGIGVDPTAFLHVPPSIAANASFRLESSVAVDPTVPNDGDFWWNGTNLYFQAGATLFDLLTLAGGLPSPINDIAGGITGNPSIDYVNRGLIDSTGVNTLEWDNRELVDSHGANALWWEGRVLQDVTGANRVSWNGSNSFLVFDLNTTTQSQLNLAPSAAVDVATPLNGDMWYNGTNLYFYNGTTNVDILTGGIPGFWSRAGTVVSPATITDQVSVGFTGAQTQFNVWGGGNPFGFGNNEFNAVFLQDNINFAGISLGYDTTAQVGVIFSQGTPGNASSALRFITFDGPNTTPFINLEMDGNSHTSTIFGSLALQGVGGSLIEMGDWSGAPTLSAIYLNGQFATNANGYNFLSDPSAPDLIINRPSGRQLLFREDNVTQMTILTGGEIYINAGLTSGLNIDAATYSVGATPGISATITTARLTPVTGAQGSMTFINGILTAQTQAT